MTVEAACSHEAEVSEGHGYGTRIFGQNVVKIFSVGQMGI